MPNSVVYQIVFRVNRSRTNQGNDRIPSSLISPSKEILDAKAKELNEAPDGFSRCFRILDRVYPGRFYVEPVTLTAGKA